ncbi:hypothetical protein [Chelativorans sp. Marseille-P2723]|uniref:hypothetical protein n=1 Tax=Chelativorans sp. Marseille-P2723 TaxID=2709133 RepID=UPI001571321D|nr:hypothetical protein [Chelativorans sp. Marseille-P2723]
MMQSQGTAVAPFSLSQMFSTASLAAVPAGGTENTGLSLSKPDTVMTAEPLRRTGRDTHFHSEAELFTGEPMLKGDLQLDRRSLIAARVMAARGILGPEAAEKEDEQFLEIANEMHLRAATNPDDYVAGNTSKVLLHEEARLWARENGAEELRVPVDSILKAFREGWSLALDLPPPPHFKRRSEIMKEVAPSIEERGRASVERKVIDLYYGQFFDYVKTHLDRYCTAKALDFAIRTGLGRFTMEYRPTGAWVIDDISVYKSWSPRGAPIAGMTKFHLTEGLQMPAFIFQLPDDRLGFIAPSGDFQFLPKHSLDKEGRIKKSSILNAFRVEARRNYGSGRGGGSLLKGSIGLSKSYFKMKYVHAGDNRASIKQIMESKVRKNVLAAIEFWKRDYYDPSAVEAFFDKLPFFEMVRRAQSDPGFEFKLEEVPWQIVNLGMAIGLSVGAGVLLRSGRGIVLAAGGAAAGTRATAAIRASLDGSKTSAYLINAGRQLTRFTVPTATSGNLAAAAATGATPVARQALSFALQKSDRLLAAKYKPSQIMDKIYRALAKNWWGGKTSPQELRGIIESRADTKIPSVLFRGQRGTNLFSSWGAVGPDKQDDYLAAIIKHSSRAGGSAGEAFSLTMDKNVAFRFIEHKQGGVLLAIDTGKDLKNFRTIENILKYDGPRLVEEKKITSGTLASAIRYAIDEGEREVFYVGGSIPADWVTQLT